MGLPGSHVACHTLTVDNLPFSRLDTTIAQSVSKPIKLRTSLFLGQPAIRLGPEYPVPAFTTEKEVYLDRFLTSLIQQTISCQGL